MVQSDLSREVLQRGLRACRDDNYIYLNNPKCACSTIKASLWAATTGEDAPQEGQTHNVAASPFSKNIAALDWAEGAFVFTFVRNPFTRVVSAYLDKIARGADVRAWRAFSDRHGLDPASGIGFDGFVEIIAAQPPSGLNPHWRPQYLNTLQPFVQPNLIGALETIGMQLPEVLARLFPGRAARVVRRSGHSTGAGAVYRDHLRDPATLERVRRLYRADFDLFGYSDDPGHDPAPLRPPPPGDHRHPGLAALAAYFAAPRRRRVRLLAGLESGPGGAALRDWAVQERAAAG